MPVAGGGFAPCDNAQGTVDTESLLLVAPWVTQAVNDKQHVVPMLEHLQALPMDLIEVEPLPTRAFSAPTTSWRARRPGSSR
jgi:hypothetical protein